MRLSSTRTDAAALSFAVLTFYSSAASILNSLAASIRMILNSKLKEDILNETPLLLLIPVCLAFRVSIECLL